MRKAVLILAVALATAACLKAPADSAQRPVSFQIDRVSLPGEGRGDYIVADSENGRLYVTHTASVHILDLATFKPVGEVTGLKKSAGVALAGGKAFASDAGGNAVVVFDPATGKTRKVIPGRRKPDAIVADGPSGKVFVFNGESKDISVIDPKTETIVKTIDVGDAPEYARSDGAGKIYFNMEDAHAIGVIDTASMTITNKIVLPDCEGPAALAVDPGNHRLFSSCGNHQLKVVNADNGKVVASLPVGEDPDGIIYDEANKRITVAARDGAWTIVDQKGPDSYQVSQLLKIDPYAKTLGFDAKTGRLFSSTADLIWPKAVPGKPLLPDASPGSFRLMVVTAH